MQTIFINSKDSGRSDTRRLLLNLADKIKIKTDIKINWNQQKVVILSPIMFIYCIINVIK